jgi:peroxiredoxin
MVRVASTMLPLGTIAPPFELPDVTTGKLVTLDQVMGSAGLMVMFICQHCPFVKYVQNELVQLGRDYQSQPIGILAISANDAANHPDDSPEQLKIMARELGFTFPLCYDESQEVAKAYTAACTPDFFLFDRDRKLAYRGQLDDARPGNEQPITGKDLRAAMDALIAGQPVSSEQKPSIGCNIKWKPGNAPDYFG